MVKAFHQTFRAPVLTHPSVPPAKRVMLRKDLIAEEFRELMTAMGFDVYMVLVPTDRQVDLVETADAICDLHYVLSGTSLEFGLPEKKLFEEVHRSNMAKANPDGSVTQLPNGKIVKPANWTPPDIAGVLQEVSQGRRLAAAPCDCHLHEQMECNFCEPRRVIL